jgi:hypothetical protein
MPHENRCGAQVRSNLNAESIAHFAMACACDGQRATGEILDDPFSF